MHDKPAYPVDSVDNALRLLVLLGERGQLRVAEAAEQLRVARSTAHRLLATLRYRGFVTQDAHRVYRLGPSAQALTSVTPRDIRGVVRPFMTELQAETGETVQLMVLEGNGVRFIDAVESEQILRIGSRIGMLLPAHRTSGGKALLAELPAAELDARYARGLNLAGDEPAVDLAAIKRKLTSVRRRGYATNFNESERGVSAIGVVLGNNTARGIGALALSIPSARCQRADVPRLAERLIDAARRASAAL